MRISQTVFLVLVLSLTLATSREPKQTDLADESRILQAEKDPGSSPPSNEAEGLRTAAVIDDSFQDLQQAKDPNCPFTVSTFVRAETGTNCDTYKAEIAGSSTKCVKDCDDKARFNEAVASARLTCADFCRKKKCPEPRYQPPEKCAEAQCGISSSCDPQACPKINQCALLQGNRVWNCICLED